MEPWEKKIQLKLETSVIKGTQQSIYTTFLFPSWLQIMENQNHISQTPLHFGLWMQIMFYLIRSISQRFWRGKEIAISWGFLKVFCNDEKDTKKTIIWDPVLSTDAALVMPDILYSSVEQLWQQGFSNSQVRQCISDPGPPAMWL